ncbi:MAG: hypothetical protein JO250_06890 [Armatimonadetes bacterium]|nr:hypothetical protein [Armatimonadota bacterium]
MGLRTNFHGRFMLDRLLTPEHKAILEEFADTEHEDEQGRVGLDDKPPTLYCQWVPTEDGAGLEWDGAEKFYYYGPWLEYLILHFLRPWGYTLNGTVRYEGVTEGVEGTISVEGDRVLVTRVPLTDDSRHATTPPSLLDSELD